jgi:hypothetical protein
VNPANQVTEFKVDALLCDSAVTSEAKLYVQGGGWNMLTPPQFPFRAPRLGLGIIVAVPYTATNQNHTLGISLQDEDGHPLQIGPAGGDTDEGSAATAQFGAQFNIGRPPILAPGDPQVIPFAMNIDGLLIDSPGAYAFVISIDGTEMQRLVFRVVGPRGQNLVT